MFKIIDNHGVGMWFQVDIKKTLEAIATSQTELLDAMPTTTEAAAYRRGQAVILRAIGTAFGMEYQDVSVVTRCK